MRRLAALLVALTGCNELLELDEPATRTSLIPIPSCDDGWRDRAPIRIENPAHVRLTDYPVAIRLDTASLVAEGKLDENLGDLRFMLTDRRTMLPYLIEKDPRTTQTLIWVKLDVIPPHGLTIYATYGAPTIGSYASEASVFPQGIIRNAGFDSPGVWTLTKPSPEPARCIAVWPAGPPINVVIGGGPAKLRLELVSDEPTAAPLSLTVSQDVVLPPGSRYVLRFEVFVVAASRGGARLELRDGRAGRILWELGPSDENLTGQRLGLESPVLAPGPLSLQVTAALVGPAAGYIKADVDALRVRKVVSPEPVAVVGAEEPNCP